MLTVTGAGISREALLANQSLPSLRAGLACLAGARSGGGVASSDVLATATRDAAAASGGGAAAIAVAPGIPGNTGAGQACAVGVAEMKPAAGAPGAPSQAITLSVAVRAAASGARALQQARQDAQAVESPA